MFQQPPPPPPTKKSRETERSEVPHSHVHTLGQYAESEIYCVINLYILLTVFVQPPSYLLLITSNPKSY